jgi:hypothetical protein
MTTWARAGGIVTGMRAGLAGACLAAAVALLGTGCSSGGGTAASSPSSSPSSSASSAICPDVTALRQSITELGHLSAGSDALAKLQTDVANVKTSLDTLRTAAGAVWKTQINDLDAALSKLGKTLSSLGSQPSATAAAAAVSTGLAGVTSSASDLLRAASVRCPGAPASPSA